MIGENEGVGKLNKKSQRIRGNLLWRLYAFFLFSFYVTLNQLSARKRSEWSTCERGEKGVPCKDSCEKERESSGRESGGVTTWFNVIYVRRLNATLPASQPGVFFCFFFLVSGCSQKQLLVTYNFSCWPSNWVRPILAVMVVANNGLAHAKKRLLFLKLEKQEISSNVSW